MSRADEIRSQAAKVRQVHTEPPAPVRPTVRTARVRRTVDLPPVRHQRLAEWCNESAVELGMARLTGQDVLAALVARLLTDETLARKIHEDLRSVVQ